MKEIYIADKEEIYTYNELEIIKVNTSADLHEKICKMQEALSCSKTSKVLFFMPKETFDLMSIFQGDNSICDINLEDVKLMMETGTKNCSKKIKDHLDKKIKTLLAFLEGGNKVFPVAIEADSLKKIPVE